MKKLITITVIIMVAAAFLVIGNTGAEAMNRESAVALTAGMVLMGIPVMHAIAHEAAHHARAYDYAFPPRYIERTKVVYVQPKHKRMHRHRDHDRDCRHGWDRHNDGRGHRDSHRDSRRHHNDDRRR
ncbi:MAG: hypothetical protein C4581_04035 [Nitrospiraceae bacterium]|nr:MAG: hypothetical protein C4581_04035 [Nitrospiraceae bacterium]